MEGFDALHLVLFGINDAQRAAITTLKNVAHHGATRFMYIVGAANDYDGLRLQKFAINHRSIFKVWCKDSNYYVNIMQKNAKILQHGCRKTTFIACCNQVAESNTYLCK